MLKPNKPGKPDKLKIKQAVIVEGRYDRAALENVIDAVIIPVNGFGVYKDKKKLALIRRYAETNGVILLTDSDNAGRQIRNYLKDCLQGCEIHHIYIPNLLEVENTAHDVLRNSFEKFNNCQLSIVNCQLSVNCQLFVTRERLFDDGLIGSTNSAKKRKELLQAMNLPENLSVTALLDVLNRCGTDDYERIVNNEGV